MTLKQYKAFVYSVELGSLVKAGEKLDCGQSGVSHLIASLEQETGFSLMTRNKKGIVLTEEGERIYHVVKEIVDGDKNLINLINKMKGGKSNKIGIGTITSVAINWLPAIMNGFKKTHPFVEYSLTDGGYGDIKKAIYDGTVDIAFTEYPANGNFYCEELYKDKLLAVIPKSHPLSQLDSVPVKSFESEPVISLAENTDADSRKVFVKAGIKPNIVYRTTDDYAMMSMVANNLGICLEPQLILSKKPEGVCVKELNPPAYRTIGLAMPFESLSNPLIVEFKDYTVNYIKSLNGEN